jgi:hypothetical protein
MEIINFPLTLTYNYVAKKRQPCLVILFAILLIDGRFYPVSFDFWVDQFMYDECVVYLSKTEIAQNMIDYFVKEGLNFENIIFDAGFS